MSSTQLSKVTSGTVSCIIPVYNGERFLAEAIDSVLAQTHPVAEIIVVDDGSTDGTRSIVENYAASSNARVHYLWQENSKRPATARNRGIQAASGEFITFLDADDLWHPERIKRHLDHFGANPDLRISVSYIQNFLMGEVSAPSDGGDSDTLTQPKPAYVLTTMMARRDVFEEIGLLNASLRFTDSAEWFLRVREAKLPLDLLPDVLVYRRLHGKNRSLTYANESRMEALRMLKTRIQK
jgi:glycosyltransferase involved in cell wall biosynthesis